MARSIEAANVEKIPAGTVLGPVRLVVADVAEQRSFYQRAIGLDPLGSSGDTVAMGAGGRPLVELRVRPEAPPRPPGTTGLFHLAILVPSRAELARSLRRVVEAGGRLTGASDHIVSEALYLRDPEGNGIEIYRDRPREQWRRSNGSIVMDTLPLDLDELMAEEPQEAGRNGMPPETRIGHVHLNVADLAAAEAFYAGMLGFDVTVRGYPGALFLSAGGYHHHVGLNTWAGPGAPPPPAASRGLDRFQVMVPADSDLDQVERRLERAGAEPVRTDEGLLVDDPSRNRLLVSAST